MAKSDAPKVSPEGITPLSEAPPQETILRDDDQQPDLTETVVNPQAVERLGLDKAAEPPGVANPHLPYRRYEVSAKGQVLGTTKALDPSEAIGNIVKKLGISDPAKLSFSVKLVS